MLFLKLFLDLLLLLLFIFKWQETVILKYQKIYYIILDLYIKLNTFSYFLRYNI